MIAMIKNRHKNNLNLVVPQKKLLNGLMLTTIFRKNNRKLNKGSNKIRRSKVSTGSLGQKYSKILTKALVEKRKTATMRRRYVTTVLRKMS